LIEEILNGSSADIDSKYLTGLINFGFTFDLSYKTPTATAATSLAKVTAKPNFDDFLMNKCTVNEYKPNQATISDNKSKNTSNFKPSDRDKVDKTIINYHFIKSKIK
jgi:hypothetical protein